MESVNEFDVCVCYEFRYTPQKFENPNPFQLMSVDFKPGSVKVLDFGGHVDFSKCGFPRMWISQNVLGTVGTALPIGTGAGRQFYPRCGYLRATHFQLLAHWLEELHVCPPLDDFIPFCSEQWEPLGPKFNLDVAQRHGSGRCCRTCM